MALQMITQTQMIDSLSERTGWSKSDVRNFLQAQEAEIVECLEAGCRVKIAGIQVEPKLKPKSKKRMGRNPATGEPVEIPAKPASVQLKVRVLASLKNSVELPSVRALQNKL